MIEIIIWKPLLFKISLNLSFKDYYGVCSSITFPFIDVSATIKHHDYYKFKMSAVYVNISLFSI